MIQQKRISIFGKNRFLQERLFSYFPLFLFNCSTSSKNQETAMSSTPGRGIASQQKKYVPCGKGNDGQQLYCPADKGKKCKSPAPGLGSVGAGYLYHSLICNNDGQWVKFCQGEDQYICRIKGRDSCCRRDMVSYGCQKDYIPCGKGNNGQQLCCPADKKKKCESPAPGLGSVSAGYLYHSLICNNDGQWVKLCQGEDQYICRIKGRDSCCRHDIVSYGCQKDYIPCGKGNNGQQLCCPADKKKKCESPAPGLGSVSAGYLYHSLICNNDGQWVKFCQGEDQYICRIKGRDSCCRYDVVDGSQLPDDDPPQGGDGVSQ